MWVNFSFSIRRWTPGFCEDNCCLCRRMAEEEPSGKRGARGRQWLDDVFLAVTAHVHIINLHRQKAKTLAAELLQRI